MVDITKVCNSCYQKELKEVPGTLVCEGCYYPVCEKCVIRSGGEVFCWDICMKNYYMVQRKLDYKLLKEIYDFILASENPPTPEQCKEKFIQTTWPNEKNEKKEIG